MSPHAPNVSNPLESAMKEIWLENFRCFRDEQRARLAPLTLLVGENSTGKTSFMAMVRALWDISYMHMVPDFKEDPYDLGSFDEIAHHRGGAGGQSHEFTAGFTLDARQHASGIKAGSRNFEVTFGKIGTTPYPTRIYLGFGNSWADQRFKAGQASILYVGTSRGSWEKKVADRLRLWGRLDEEMTLPPLSRWFRSSSRDPQSEEAGFTPLTGSPPFSSSDWEALWRLDRLDVVRSRERLFASAPVRSEPRRTYEPSRALSLPQGYYIPMYLANTFLQDKETWVALKRRLENFGSSAGLFDEISIKPLGKMGSEPFQLQVRRFDGGLKGPRRNLIDVGYGVSQVLPVITELLRRDAPPMFLLQQPEVHLHPSAQAALGSLFCRIASPRRQLIVETHSDHLLDRVRMEVRDGEIGLKPEDVSILYFERGSLDVRIHSLQIDEAGNIQGAPDTYRTFFMEETQRSLWTL